MKKAIPILAITLLLVSIMSITAFAHGGHGKAIQRKPQYQLCTVDGCDVAGAHQHDGSWYCSQTAWQGNYQICTVDGCSQLGLHEHGGTYYYCDNHGTGNGCGRWRRQ